MKVGTMDQPGPEPRAEHPPAAVEEKLDDVAQDQEEDQQEQDQDDVEEGEEQVGVDPQQAQLDPGQDDDEEDGDQGQRDLALALATFLGRAFLHGNETGRFIHAPAPGWGQKSKSNW